MKQTSIKMDQKLKASTQHSSDSHSRVYKIAKSRLRCFRSVTSKLYIARKKLLPVINDILNTASQNSEVKPGQQGKSYYLTIDQYKDAMWAARLLKEVDEVLKLDKNRNPSFKTQNFNFDAKVKVNKGGRIYIDTPILLQLIDLHNLLGDIIDFLQEIPQDEIFTTNEDTDDQKSLESKSLTISTGSSEDTDHSETTKNTKEILTTLTYPLNTDFVVMAANNTNSKSNLRSSDERKLQSQMSVKNQSKPVLHSSTRVVNAKEEVVDAAGAKKIIVKCMTDLDKVRQFLERDFAVHTVTVEAAKSNSPLHAQNSGIPTQNVDAFLVEESNEYDAQNGCCCMDNCPGDQPLEFTWKENGETGSKLVICIKGKSEEDGDIHVVIRQCPDCLHSVVTDENEEYPRESIDSNVPNKVSSTRCHIQSNRSSLDQPVDPSFHSTKEPSKKDVSNSKHMVQSSVIREPSHHSTHEPSCQQLGQKSNHSQHVNVVFDPDDPRHSIVNGPHIRLNDTINLTLESNEVCHQDLVIALQVKPKGVASKPILNIDDIFTDSQASVEKSKISVNQSNSRAKLRK